MKRKIICLLSVILALVFCISLVSCYDNDTDIEIKDEYFKNVNMPLVYQIYLDYMDEIGETPLTYDAWFDAVHGDEFQMGVIPEIRKNDTTDFWEISYNNGKGWNDLKFKTETEAQKNCNHTFGKWIILCEGNDYCNGIRYRSCKYCNYKDYQFKFNDDVCLHLELITIEGKPATCISKGLTEGKKCAKCGEIVVKQEEVDRLSHTYDDKYDAFCNVCGYERPIVCSHTEVTIIPGTPATCTEQGLTDGKRCAKCGVLVEAQQTISSLGHTVVIDKGVPATYESDGLTEGSHCSACGKVLVPQYVINKLERPTECPEVHTTATLGEGNYIFISEHARVYCGDVYYHVYQCSICDQYFADCIERGVSCQFERIKPDTCTEVDIMMCVICGYSVSTFVGGEHNWNTTVIVEPTCTTNGVAHNVCVACGYDEYVDIVPDDIYIGHTWVKGEAQQGKCFNDEEGTTQPTIIAGYYCEDCGVSANVGQVITVDGVEVVVVSQYSVIYYDHDIDFDMPTTLAMPTCSNFGFECYACRKCGYVAKVDILSPLGHVYDKDTFDHVSTMCEKNSDDIFVAGRDVWTGICMVCCCEVQIVEEHYIVRDIVKAPTCIEGGYTYDYCSVCDMEFNKRNVTSANPNAHSFYTSVSDAKVNGDEYGYGIECNPTCSEPGLAYTHCRYCKVPKMDVIIPATGHNIVVVIEPTCTCSGRIACIDPLCDFYEIVPMLKHVDENGNVIECVAEDFYCYRCQSDAYGDIPEETGKLSWIESHYETSVTVVSGVCTEWQYVLYVCKACEFEWMENEPCYYHHDSYNSYWVIIKEATFEAPGEMALICGRDGCNYVYEIREYAYGE